MQRSYVYSLSFLRLSLILLICHAYFRLPPPTGLSSAPPAMRPAILCGMSYTSLPLPAAFVNCYPGFPANTSDYPADTLRMSFEYSSCPSSALRTPFERPSNAYECPSNTPRMPYEYPSECLTNALRMPYECLTNALHNLSESPDRISHFFPELLWTRSPAFPGAVRP